MKPRKAASEIEKAAAILGARGGRAGTGAAKRRKVTSEQARAAANARWKKRLP